MAALNDVAGSVPVAEKKSFEALPDGKYICIINDVKIGNKGNPDKLTLQTRWAVSEGEHAGKLAFNDYYLQKNNGAWNEGSIGIMKRDMETLGIEEPEDWTNLGASWLAVKDDIAAEITLKTKEGSDYPDVYVNKLVG